MSRPVLLWELFGTSSAWALKITLDGSNAGNVGESLMFRVASVDGAVGAVSVRWNFGDGTTTDFGPAATVVLMALRLKRSKAGASAVE